MLQNNASTTWMYCELLSCRYDNLDRGPCLLLATYVDGGKLANETPPTRRRPLKWYISRMQGLMWLVNVLLLIHIQRNFWDNVINPNRPTYYPNMHLPQTCPPFALSCTCSLVNNLREKILQTGYYNSICESRDKCIIIRNNVNRSQTNFTQNYLALIAQ